MLRLARNLLMRQNKTGNVFNIVLKSLRMGSVLLILLRLETTYNGCHGVFLEVR